MSPKKSNPKISVCMPVRNAELWLAEAIDSIINQTFEDWELIVVDDASDDSTKEILAHYAELLGDKMNGHVFESQQGIAICRNKANQIARGEIICVQDSDDYSHKERLKKTWNFFKRHPKVDLIYGACQYVDALGKPFHMVHAEPFDFNRLKVENWIQHPTVAYRRSVALEIPYRWQCRVIDDWFLYFDWAKSGQTIQPIEDVLAFYRVLEDSVSRSPEKEKEIREMKELFLKEAAEYEDSRLVGQ